MRLACLCVLLLPIGGCATSWLPVLSVHAVLTSTRRVAQEPITQAGAGAQSTRSLRSIVGVSAGWSTTSNRRHSASRHVPPVVEMPRRPVCGGSTLCGWERRARVDALLALGATP